MYHHPSSTNSFSHLTSSIHGFSPPNSFSQDNLYPTQNNRQDLLQGFYFASNPEDIPAHPEKKKKGITICKKDRHSKIYTAQGPRDRRVRLSMDIARKFFDLQDMLGFDKASKTLDWLLTKSKESIKELVNMKMKVNNNGSGCLFEMVYNSSNNNNEKIMRDAFDSSSRESRAKARARARDRTREKMRVRSMGINGQDLITSSTSPNHSFSKSRSWPQIEHIPDIWDINTDLTPQEVEYHGKSWDAYKNYSTIRED